jgi:hypothetical protein
LTCLKAVSSLKAIRIGISIKTPSGSARRIRVSHTRNGTKVIACG